MRINWTDHATLLWYTSLQYGILHLCLSRPFKQRTLDHTSKEKPYSQSLTNEEKYTLLTHHFKSGNRYNSFPTTILHNKLRSIKKSWQSAHPWLGYSESEDGGFLKYCMMFWTYTAAGAVVNSALKNFNRGTDILKEHHKKQYQIDASVKKENFIKIMPEQYVHS